MTRFRAVIALASAGFCESVSAADTVRTQVMLLGTYHFSNPGKDIHNVKAVDVLTAERQRELGAVIAAVGKFAPTRVAVEWPAQVVREQYAKFREGQLPESRNEVVQLSFRLARERGLQTVHGLDVAGDFPFEAIVAWARQHGRASEIDAMLALGGKEVAHISALQERATIGGVLRDLNTRESIERNHSFHPPASSRTCTSSIH